jgi:hypothetical protein
MKTPTLKEKVSRYEDFLHKLNACLISGNNEAIGELIQNADNWSYAHRRGNGELSDKKQQEIINNAFWKLLDTPNSDAIVKERQRKWTEAQKQKNIELISDEKLIGLAKEPKYAVYHKPTKLWVYFRYHKDKFGIIGQTTICLSLKCDATVYNCKETLENYIKIGEFNGDPNYGKNNFLEFQIKKL